MLAVGTARIPAARCGFLSLADEDIPIITPGEDSDWLCLSERERKRLHTFSPSLHDREGEKKKTS